MPVVKKAILLEVEKKFMLVFDCQSVIYIDVSVTLLGKQQNRVCMSIYVQTFFKVCIRWSTCR